MRIRLSSMIARTVALFVALVLSSVCLAAQPDVTAFVHVNVVPMDRERVLTDQTVLVQNGIVSAIGRNVKIPSDARLIDSRGKFLSPGLADMHSHSETREDMKVYLANGVTTVLNLGGASSDFVDQRLPLLNRGERPGPHVYVALRVDGTPDYGQLVITNADEARSVVRLAKTNGYQFIKVYNNLSPEVFAALSDEASKQGLGLAGHWVRAIPMEQELASGHVLVAHLEELMYSLFTPPDDDPLAPPADDVIPKAVAMLKANHGFVVADLVTFGTIAEQWGRPDVLNAYFAKPDAKYVPFEWRLDWRRGGYENKKGSLDRRAAFLGRLAKALADENVPLLAGTDAPTIPGVVPGFSLHDDLDRLTAAGLSRYQALSTATRLPGEYISQSIADAPPFGEVQPGYRADLILSAHNPLADLATLRNPEGVMAHGRWYSGTDLHALLDQVKADYAAAASVSVAN
jgi:hypothetical protein